VSTVRKEARVMYEGMDDFIAVGEEIVDKVQVIKAKDGEQRFLCIVG
jgi:hypothetical protein